MSAKQCLDICTSQPYFKTHLIGQELLYPSSTWSLHFVKLVLFLNIINIDLHSHADTVFDRTKFDHCYMLRPLKNNLVIRIKYL
jgi:hypothetical protein